ncbi:retrovirus-related pol polyprotein from transposon TNT 1-94 [Tanacetum coccineum]
MHTPSKEDLDNSFGPMFEEYYEQKSLDTPIYSAAQPTQVHEDSPSTSSIIVDTHEAPPVVTTSDEQTSPISLIEADEFNQEDTAKFDVPLNVQNFHQVQPSTHIWTKDHPLDKVIGDPSKPVMTRQWLHTDSELWKNKCDAENIVVRNKTRLVAKGYKQDEGIDFEESFALGIVLKKALYGLKQAPHAWYDKLSSFLIEHGFTKDADHAGCKDDCKNTSGGLQFLGGKLLFGCVLNCLTMDISTIGFRCTVTPRVPLLFHAIRSNILRRSTLTSVIIMAQQQHAADVHPDELCPPNKRYDLMDANKKVDLEHVQSSSSVPWIYMAQFWHTLKEDRSKYRLRFMLDKKERTLTLDDFRQIFHLPQATTNNHNAFVPPPSFSDMVPFYKQVLGFTMELKTQSNFKTTGLLQPWQTLCKIFSKCLTTRVTGWDQPPLQIMQMLYCFVNNIHVDYAELLWEGLYYSLHHPTSSIPYPRFTKIIVNHYMTIFPDISRRARDMYHNLQDDDIMKNIFNSGRHKNKVGMKIPDWMITDEMKQTEHYRMTTSAPRSPNPDKEVIESSARSRSTMIRLRLLEMRSIRLTPPAPVPTVDKADEIILQDTLQVSLAEHKSREEQEARENVALVDEHLASEEIEKMVEEQENIVDDSSIPRNDESNIPGTRIEPQSDKESPEVEIAKEKEVEITQETEVEITQETPAVDITNVIIPVNVTDEDEEITDEVYELKRREKGKNVEETRNSPIPTPIGIS